MLSEYWLLSPALVGCDITLREAQDYMKLHPARNWGNMSQKKKEGMGPIQPSHIKRIFTFSLYSPAHRVVPGMSGGARDRSE